MPPPLGDDAQRQPMRRVGPGEAVEDKHLAALEVVYHPRVQALEMRPVHRLIDLAPPDAGFARDLAHEELVRRRPPRALASKSDQCAVARQRAFAPTEA